MFSLALKEINLVLSPAVLISVIIVLPTGQLQLLSRRGLMLSEISGSCNISEDKWSGQGERKLQLSGRKVCRGAQP